MGLLKFADPKSQLGQELERYRQLLFQEAGAIAQSFKFLRGLDSIYLIGSVVRGPVDYDSDIDLVLVVESADLIESTRKQIHSKRWSKFPLDLIVISKSELRTPDLGSGIVSEVKARGVCLL